MCFHFTSKYLFSQKTINESTRKDESWTVPKKFGKEHVTISQNLRKIKMKNPRIKNSFYEAIVIHSSDLLNYFSQS